VREGEEERLVSREVPRMAWSGGALEAGWRWRVEGAPLGGLPGSTRATPSD